MRVTSNTETTGRFSVTGAGTSARAIEKTSPSSALHDFPPQAQEAEHSTSPRVQGGLVCQYGTETFDPNWDGPRLLPTFVAQLLGQVIPERRQNVAVETAYGTARLGRTALLVDRRS
jgi:hypothetical protein